MKAAIVHDYLREFGGAERVVEALHEIWPEAPIYVAYKNLDQLGPHKDRVKKWNIKTSWIQYLPFADLLISPLRLIAPQVFTGFDLSQFDVVISSCNIYFSKAVRTSKNQLHISYIHTPPRYLYGFTTSFNYRRNWFTRVVGEMTNHYLRVVDFEVSQNPDILVANSKNVQERINKFYRRESVVIYPPVEVERFKSARVVGEGGYFLSVSRLVKGKGIEMIVQVCTKLRLPLKVVGSGPQLKYLRSIAGPTVEFLGSVNDTHLAGIYASAGATIVASEDEDFGIVPVESMAAGTPVIALKAGGFLETVIPGKTGEFFPSARSARSGQVDQVKALERILKDFDHSKYQYQDLIKQAEKFSKESFKNNILKLIADNFRS